MAFLDRITNESVVREGSGLWWRIDFQPLVNEAAIRTRFLSRTKDANGLIVLTTADITWITNNNVLHADDVKRVQAHQRGGRSVYIEDTIGRFRLVAGQQG